VISSAVKVLVLAVIVGIGSTLFYKFTAAWCQSADHRHGMAPCAWAFPLLASGIFGLALRTAPYRVDRNLCRKLPSAPAWPLVAPSWLARVSQPWRGLCRRRTRRGGSCRQRIAAEPRRFYRAGD